MAENGQAGEQAKLVAELEAGLFQCEQREEALIEAAAEGGVELLRRADASPVAVLGVMVAVKQT